MAALTTGKMMTMSQSAIPEDTARTRSSQATAAKSSQATAAKSNLHTAAKSSLHTAVKSNLVMEEADLKRRPNMDKRAAMVAVAAEKVGAATMTTKMRKLMSTVNVVDEEVADTAVGTKLLERINSIDVMETTRRAHENDMAPF